MRNARTIDYDHASNTHSAEGAYRALSIILGEWRPESLLDVGCGTGTWLRAAIDLGIADASGIDGIEVAQNDLHVPKTTVRTVDLRNPFSVNRYFSVALCLEVAEHLPPSSAPG